MSGEIDDDSGETVPENATSPFPNPCEDPLDYTTDARGHIIQQYREQPKAVATVEALVANTEAMEAQLATVPPMDDPAIAGGVNLDVTGELVGQGRVLSNGTISTDTFYRALIAARIDRNGGHATSPEFIAALEAVVFTGAFRFYDLGGMSVGIEVDGEPTSDQKAILNDGPMPIAMAVGLSKLWYDGTAFFGFQGDPRPGLDGFGLESDLSLGGQLGMLF
jgi:hypothetical protein